MEKAKWAVRRSTLFFILSSVDRQIRAKKICGVTLQKKHSGKIFLVKSEGFLLKTVPGLLSENSGIQVALVSYLRE